MADLSMGHEGGFDAPSPEEAEVLALLGSIPAPRMPADVSARIEAAIAAEAGATVVDIRSRRRWVTGLAAAAAAVVIVGAAAVVLRPSSPTIPGQVGPALASGTDYSAGSLADQASLVLANAGLGNPTAQSSARVAPAEASALATTFAASSTGIASCVSGITGGNPTSVIAMDVATFEGSPAVLVVTPGATPGQATATVVSPGCSAQEPGVLASTTVRTS